MTVEVYFKVMPLFTYRKCTVAQVYSVCSPDRALICVTWLHMEKTLITAYFL